MNAIPTIPRPTTKIRIRGIAEAAVPELEEVRRRDREPVAEEDDEADEEGITGTAFDMVAYDVSPSEGLEVEMFYSGLSCVVMV